MAASFCVLLRHPHTSHWSISVVISKITLVCFWQASVIAANEHSTSYINQRKKNASFFSPNPIQSSPWAESWEGVMYHVMSSLTAAGYRWSYQSQWKRDCCRTGLQLILHQLLNKTNISTFCAHQKCDSDLITDIIKVLEYGNFLSIHS